MTEHFHIEPIEGTNYIRAFARSNENLPIEFDCGTRFCVVASLAERHLERIRDFEVRSNDVWVVTPPKSGTTWMLELVWLLQNNYDFETALKTDQNDRVPFLELPTILTTRSNVSFDVYEKMPSPRVMKSHLPIHLLPKGLWTVKPKIIFVTRNPKDAIVSFFHHHTALGTFRGSKEEYMNRTLDNKQRYSPFAETTFEFWQLRNEPNIYFTSFERMKKDLRLVICTLSKFLGKDIDDEELIIKLLDHLSFKNMQKNPACNHVDVTKAFNAQYGIEPNHTEHWFIRKGEVGSYKSELSEAVKERLEKWFAGQLERHGVTAEEIFLSELQKMITE